MLCLISFCSKGIIMGWLFEHSDKSEGVTVHSVGSLTCFVQLCVALLSCIVFLPAFRVGLMPVMRLRIRSIASNLSGCVAGCPLMALSRFLIVLAMRSALLMVGMSRVWWRNVKVSARRTAPVPVMALMH